MKHNDPSRKELLTYARTITPDADSFDVEEAIYWFAYEYHGGQGTELYRALSTSGYRPGILTDGPAPDTDSTILYEAFAEEYG